MNASRLREMVNLILSREKQYKVQAVLTELNTALNQLVSQPQDAAIQSQFSAVLEKLNGAAGSMRASFEPTQIPLLQEIGAHKFFVHNFVFDLSASIRENPLSPAVTQTNTQSLKA